MWIFAFFLSPSVSLKGLAKLHSSLWLYTRTQYICIQWRTLHSACDDSSLSLSLLATPLDSKKASVSFVLRLVSLTGSRFRSRTLFPRFPCLLLDMQLNQEDFLLLHAAFLSFARNTVNIAGLQAGEYFILFTLKVAMQEVHNCWTHTGKHMHRESRKEREEEEEGESSHAAFASRGYK